MSAPRRRVLFVAEAVTLAQVVRLFVLARSLDPARYEVHFACAHFDPLIFAGARFVQHALFTVDHRRVLRAAERGRRLYDRAVLERYVKEELALFGAVRPDVVVGDLRFSLSVSAPHAGVPYAALINATWSRHIVREALPVPDHPILRVLGERLGARYFPRALPRVLAHFAVPVNELRVRYGLAPLGDLIDVMMFGERVLFPDVPWLTPLSGAPSHHVFLGPVLWSPQLALPNWWARATSGPAPIYVTLGSSGRVDRLRAVLAGLRRLGRPLLVATAGRCKVDNLEPRVFTADYLPGDEAVRRAALVVCNGGSSTGYQALCEGRPLLGVASNFDQFLNMGAVRERGAGILLRASTVSPERVEAAARALLEQPSYAEAAARGRREIMRYDASSRFEAALTDLL